MDKKPETPPEVVAPAGPEPLPPPPMQLEPDPVAGPAPTTPGTVTGEQPVAAAEPPRDLPAPAAPTSEAPKGLPKDASVAATVSKLATQQKPAKFPTTKPIFIIVVSVVLFTLLCVVAFVAYGKSN